MAKNRVPRAITAVAVLLALSGQSIAARPAEAQASPTLIRGIYGGDGSDTWHNRVEGLGFNAVNSMHYRADLDRIQANGLKAVVWMGGYDNETCTWEKDDQWISAVVADLEDHPGVIAYQLGDEPNFRLCPSSPAQLRARHDLVKVIDPNTDTYTVVAAWDGRQGFPYEHFAGTTDIMGLDVYPCGTPCKYADIDEAIAQADADGVPRYWAVVQAFSDNWYRMPTSSELTSQFEHWKPSRMEGYFVYSWDVGDLANKPEHLAALEAVNKAGQDSVTSPSPPVVLQPVSRTPVSLRTGVRGRGALRTVRLRWKGTDLKGRVVVVRNGKRLYTTPDDGFHVDRPSRYIQRNTYRICGYAIGSRCSNIRVIQ